MARLIQSSSIPSFHVHKNGVNQSLPVSGSFQLITWSTALLDTFGDFDLANDRFVPKTPGKYLLCALLGIDNLAVSVQYATEIRKNGATSYFGNNEVTSAGFSDPSRTVLTLVEANGTTDYFEVYARHSDASARNIVGIAGVTFFTGYRIGA